MDLWVFQVIKMDAHQISVIVPLSLYGLGKNIVWLLLY